MSILLSCVLWSLWWEPNACTHFESNQRLLIACTIMCITCKSLECVGASWRSVSVHSFCAVHAPGHDDLDLDPQSIKQG